MGQPIFAQKQVMCHCGNPADTDFSAIGFGACSVKCYLEGVELGHTHNLRHTELNRLIQLSDSLEEILPKNLPPSIGALRFPFRHGGRIYLNLASSYWISNLTEEHEQREKLVKSADVELPDDVWEIIFQLKNKDYGVSWRFCKERSLRVDEFKGEADYDNFLGIEYKDEANTVLGSADLIEITGTGKPPGRELFENLCLLILRIDIERGLTESEKNWVEIRPTERPCIVAIRRFWDDQRTYSINWEICVFP